MAQNRTLPKPGRNKKPFIYRFHEQVFVVVQVLDEIGLNLEELNSTDPFSDASI